MRLTFCIDGVCSSLVVSIPDTAVMSLSDGTTKVANQIVGCTKASLQVDGADANGHVIYTASCGGDHGNGIVVEHTTGATGVGHEDRPLLVERVGGGKQLRVTFGTDANGNSVLPAAQAVVDAVTAAADISFVTATSSGTGLGLAGLVGPTNLAGGLDDGDWVRLPFDPRCVRQVCDVRVD